MKKFLHEEEYVEVGFIRKPYGYKGDVKVSSEPEFEEDVKESTFLFIEQKGLRVPFKIVEWTDVPELIMRFDYINSSEEVTSLIGQKAFLLKKDIKYAEDYLHDDEEKEYLVGFILEDVTNGESFEIIRLEDFPQQLMAVIIRDGKELYIPLNDQFITEVKKEEKIITMELPDGLLNL